MKIEAKDFGRLPSLRVSYHAWAGGGLFTVAPVAKVRVFRVGRRRPKVAGTRLFEVRLSGGGRVVGEITLTPESDAEKDAAGGVVFETTIGGGRGGYVFALVPASHVRGAEEVVAGFFDTAAAAASASEAS